MPPSYAAIVTTLRDAGAVIGSFVAYHRRLGFDHFFLFFDDPQDPSIVWARAQRDVTVVRHDEELQQAWSRLPGYARYGQHVEREVMARQVLNVEHAMNLARKAGLRWLLHIDADELFYLPGGSAARHFTVLEKSKLDAINYLNYEAVPEREDIEDFFREVTLFRRSLLLPPRPDDAALRLIQATPQLAPGFFHFYDNGKSAVRLSTAGMRPQGVHEFVGPEGYAVARSSKQFILHYACCGFEAFWQKYRALGRFDDRWWGKTSIAEAIGHFHLESRDVVSSGDRESARRFYRERVMIDSPERIGALVEHRLLERIELPRQLLGMVQAGPTAG